MRKMYYLCTRFSSEVARRKAKTREFRDFSGNSKNREVAQLVAHHGRDVGVGRSSRLFSTKGQSKWLSFLFCPFCLADDFLRVVVDLDHVA